MVSNLVEFDEMQHLVTGQWLKFMEGDKQRYPDEVFFTILFERGCEAHCLHDLEWAVEFAFRYMRKR
jgi:hypothetical protein